MLQHYADLVLAKKSGRRVDWISVTAEMSALGFKTTTGEPLKPETVRRTWHRLDADVAAGVVVPPAGSPRAAITKAGGQPCVRTHAACAWTGRLRRPDPTMMIHLGSVNRGTSSLAFQRPADSNPRRRRNDGEEA